MPLRFVESASAAMKERARRRALRTCEGAADANPGFAAALEWPAISETDHVCGRSNAKSTHSSHRGSDSSRRAWDECHAGWDESRLEDNESHRGWDECHAGWNESRLKDNESHRAWDECHRAWDESQLEDSESDSRSFLTGGRDPCAGSCYRSPARNGEQARGVAPPVCVQYLARLDSSHLTCLEAFR